MLQSSDVFIIGGGPAGLATAIAARQRNFSVIVADGNTPPIDKPCGEGLMPDSVAALQQLGVSLGVNDGFSFCGIDFVDGEISTKASFPHDAGVGLRRTILHEKMLQRAMDLGVHFLWKTPVTGIADGQVQLAGGTQVVSRWIVGADGTQSRVRRWAGLDGLIQPSERIASRGHFAIAAWSDHVEVHWGNDAQAYVTPVSADEVCVVVVSKVPRRDLAAAIKEFPALKQRLRDTRPTRPERGAFTTMRSLQRVYRRNVALIGDASGSVDAITGEGLSLSFHQAQALAGAMAENDLTVYQAAHRRLARRPAFMARLLLLLDGRPRLRRRTFRAFARHPELFARLVSIHVGETSPAHFAATGAMLGWRFLAA